MLTILTGDCRSTLRTLPDASVNCCVTSPPYYGLRSYLPDGHASKALEIGQEDTPEEYVANLVAVFREVKRALRDDGVLWLNLSDSSVASSTSNHGRGKAAPALNGRGEPQAGGGWENPPRKPPAPGYKPKDLVGIPWMAAFALRDDGWYLRSEIIERQEWVCPCGCGHRMVMERVSGPDIIWNKPNPMPESVTDRPTRSHETVFLLTKSARYWYDSEAVKEPAVYGDHPRNVRGLTKTQETPGQPPHTGLHAGVKQDGHSRRHAGFNDRYFDGTEAQEMRNLRDVWTFPSGQSDVKHYAMMPPEMAKRCILAGCPVGGVVLDPFGGSGTTGKVAIELGRRAILCELNPEYVGMIEQRTQTTIGMGL